MPTGSLNPDEVRIIESGNVYYRRPSATNRPTDAGTPLHSSFQHGGYVDNESVSLSPDISIESVMKWQSKMAVKVYVSEIGLQVNFTMNQVNRENFGLWLFGQEWENAPNGESHLAVPSNVTIGDLERELVIEFTDDQDDTTRFYFTRGVVTDREELTLGKTDVKLGVTYMVLDAGNDLMFDVWSTNDDLYSA